ncbi:PREDICTED: nucleoside diphosphate-linked moiety X motif 19, mitochondrial [Calidris pugnax]|uniref:nucleoside diphosphate-linked moiety X motif 19, mitochondrial n=1 Tax=Calidris pugnax TaxID=198806 RepID=UPI00071DD325|nr:PREDICTED: nucleoside diphosphate-linked moiety X motif 19, mitochondrial [Calidris pugnax]
MWNCRRAGSATAGTNRSPRFPTPRRCLGCNRSLQQRRAGSGLQPSFNTRTLAPVNARAAAGPRERLTTPEVCKEIESHRLAPLRARRRRVRQDPSCFLQLCRRLGCAPDIWALQEWSNWLTPVGRAGGRRYDTAFYLCCLQQRPPHASQDDQEVTALLWSSPPEAIERFKSQELWFAPPQFYELCRLCNFSSLRELHQFSSDRALEGCERWMPVMLTASDGYIQLLPGDELYPEDPDYTGEKKVIMSTDKKVEDLMKEGSVFHRIVIKNINNLAVYVNIQAKYKHKNPVMIESRCSNHNSRL